MVKRVARQLLLCSLVLALSGQARTDAQVTAKQGEKDPTEFSGSMVLQAPFPPALPGSKVGDWYTTADFTRMRLYRCDRVIITLFQFKVDSAQKGTIPIKARVWLYNPNGNHDKSVELVLEVMNDEQKVTEARRSIKVEESDVAKRDIDLPVPAGSLVTDPPTLLKITLRTRDV